MPGGAEKGPAVNSLSPLLDCPSVEAAAPAGSRLGDRLLNIAAVVGILVMGLTVAAHVSGYQPLVVRSGSMEPTIATGSMVLVRSVPIEEIGVGDVVSVVRADGTRVMHRVLTTDVSGGAATLTLQGDANEDPDPAPVVAREADALVWTVPGVGRAAAFLASAKGGFVLGCLITGVGMTTTRRREP